MNRSPQSKNLTQGKIKHLSVFLIGLSVFIISFSIILNYVRTSTNLKSESTRELTINKLKTDMLSSTDPRVIVVGIALDYYPREHLVLAKGGGVGTYPFKFHGIELTEVQYTKLVEYFQSIRQFPFMDYQLQNILHGDYTPKEGLVNPPHTPEWLRFLGPRGNNLVQKDGFVCLYPLAETKVDGVWRPEGYDSQFIAPNPLVFRCSYFAEPSENSSQKVAPFIKEFLANEGVASIDEQDVTDWFGQGGKHLNEESFSMPDYTASTTYTEKYYGGFTDELKSELSLELDHVSQYFENASWYSEIKETTNSNLIRNWFSLDLTATNETYECQVDIEVWGDKYTYYYPKEKELRDQYLKYSDEEFEKNVLGGEVKRKIICFKSLEN